MRHKEQVLERMAREHVAYSLRMSVALASKPVPNGDIVLGNAMLESYLMHCRNLSEFLSKRPGDGSPLRPSDIIAADFFDDPDRLKTFDLPAWFDTVEIHRRLATSARNASSATQPTASSIGR